MRFKQISHRIDNLIWKFQTKLRRDSQQPFNENFLNLLSKYILKCIRSNTTWRVRPLELRHFLSQN